MPKPRRKAHRDRYAHLNEPQDVLDFHAGRPLTGSEIKRATIAFVEEAKGRGLTRVLIVTGRGTRSRAGPVAKPQVARTLGDLEREGTIRSYAPGKAAQGGDGAFLVDL